MRFRGFVYGLEPLAPLALCVVLTIVLAWLARQITASAGFYTQQWAAGIVVVLGLLSAFALLIIFSVRAFRQVKYWQEVHRSAEASAALWGLVVVALVVLLPLLLAIFIPQHPAPILTH
ncbi:MAG: hypothetical protein ACLQUY_14030 [Ktedonobacterales bacterium]